MKIKEFKRILKSWVKINEGRYGNQKKDNNNEGLIESPDFQLGLLEGFYDGLARGYSNALNLMQKGGE